MKTALVERYGPPGVVRIADVPKPVPGDGDVLIHVHATTVNSGDARMRAFRVPRGLAPLMRVRLGMRGPRNPVGGFELAGEVEAVGKNVTRFSPGDRVIGSAGLELACHAEYRCLPEDGALARIPSGLGYAQAVSVVFGGTTALKYFRAGHLAAGEEILINGASGAVGVIAVQLAKYFGAKVTGVCSAANAALVKSVGADVVIDYATTDFTKLGRAWDVVMDNVGTAPFSRAKTVLRPGGRFLMVIGDLPLMLEAPFNHRIVTGGSHDGAAYNAENMALLMELAKSGVLKAVIDRRFPFDRIAEAHARVDSQHKVGSVVLTLD